MKNMGLKDIHISFLIQNRLSLQKVPELNPPAPISRRINRIKNIMAKFKIPAMLVVPIQILILAAFSFLVGLIAHWCGAYNPNGWGFYTLFSILGSVIVYVFARQIWWFVSGTGDYMGREGLLKRLYKKIFKK